MASFCSRLTICLALFVLILGSANAQLSTNFYYHSCPNLFSTVKSTVQSAISKETRMGASLLRLFFHDCFVNVIYMHLLKHTYKYANQHTYSFRLLLLPHACSNYVFFFFVIHQLIFLNNTSYFYFRYHLRKSRHT